MASGEYTFYPQFSEVVTLHRGVMRVWIADGTDSYPGSPGLLRAQYADNAVQDLGYVSTYERAAELIPGLTYEQWINLIHKVPDYARDSEAYAVGTINTIPISEGQHIAYRNSAKYYAEENKKLTIGENLDGQIVQPTENGKYFADQAKIAAYGTNLAGQTVAPENNAEYFKGKAKQFMDSSLEYKKISEAWAEGTKGNERAPEYENKSSKHWSEVSQLWANNGQDGDTPGPENNARKYAIDANNSSNNAAQHEDNASAAAANAALSEYNANLAEQHSRNIERWVETQKASIGQTAENVSTNATNAHNSEVAAREYRDDALGARDNYPTISANNTWELWDPTAHDKVETNHPTIAQANVTYSYQISDRARIEELDDNAWVNEIPQASENKGNYLWCKMHYVWTNGKDDTYYNVAYIGVDGGGGTINSINRVAGATVVLDAKDIPMDRNHFKQGDPTVYSVLSAIDNNRITNNQIDTLFHVGSGQP